MSEKNSATVSVRPPLRSGALWGFIGVAGFSLTVPLTRVAVDGGHFSPLFVGTGRAVVAGVLALLALTLTRQRHPNRSQWIRLAIVAGGIVFGFPLLTAYALTKTEASHGAVVIAALPVVTAITVVLRTREATKLLFWISATLGASAAITFACIQSGHLGGFGWSDFLLFGAVAAAAIGYAEGGLVARELGAWQTTCWALTLALPISIALTSFSFHSGVPDHDLKRWGAFAYLSLISMFLAFFAWYRGLALGPMPTVSQIQLTQPVLSILWAALLLGEHVTITTFLGGLAVIACATIAVRVRMTPAKPHFAHQHTHPQVKQRLRIHQYRKRLPANENRHSEDR